MNAAPPPRPSDAASATRSGSGLTPAQLAKLRPHVISLTDGRLASSSPKSPRSVDEYRTSAADLARIFAKDLPEFVAANQPGPVPVVLYAHGGLVDKESGFGIAARQVEWWKQNGIYPIHFAWETGFGTALWDAMRGWASGGRRGWVDEAKDGFLEVAARLLGGGGIWNDMKVDAAAAARPGGGARAFVEALAEWMTKNPDAITVHAVGHSAGSIFHSHLVPAALDAGVPAFETVNLLAPAVRVDTFSKLLLPRAQSGDVRSLAIFTMDDEAERADTCIRVYNKSLLYLVSASFEPQKATPILGMEKYLTRDVDVNAFFTGSKPTGDLVLAPHAAGARRASTATAHGAFDNDAPTMESVARRVANAADVTRYPSAGGRAPVPWPRYEDLAPSPAGARSAERPSEAATPDGSPAPPAAGGARRALCIGINAYPDAGDELQGCVPDARAWAAAFRAAGFDVTELADAAATRDAILRGILELVSGASPGDVLAVQYSGHGTFVPDLDGDEDDGDVASDEALCPVDFRRTGRLIIDDDLARIWDVIPEGVSLTCFFDSCHSGSANRAPKVDLAPRGDARPRAVVLSRADIAAYRADRGAGTDDGSGATDSFRNAGIAAVQESEMQPTAQPRAAGVRREILFSACRPTEVAWESGGQGDFTRHALPLLSAQLGMASNRSFLRSVLEEFGQNRRQTPEFHGDDVLGGRALLAPSAAALPVEPVEPDRAPGSTVSLAGATAIAADGDGRDEGHDAAVAAFLRATADLLEH